MTSSKQIAEFFLKLSDPEIGDVISNLKVQKLVYYAQGFHLAMYDDPLFEEEIYAWEHGPVVPDLYHEYKCFGSGEIRQPEDYDAYEILTVEQIDLLKEVYLVYGQYSAWKLRDMTHNERPWAETRRGEVINLELLKEYFKTQLA